MTTDSQNNQKSGSQPAANKSQAGTDQKDPMAALEKMINQAQLKNQAEEQQQDRQQLEQDQEEIEALKKKKKKQEQVELEAKRQKIQQVKEQVVSTQPSQSGQQEASTQVNQQSADDDYEIKQLGHTKVKKPKQENQE